MPPQQPNFNQIPPLNIPPSIDPQTKNIMLFAIIFTVLALGAVVYVVFKPDEKSDASAKASSSATSTISTTTSEVKPKKPSLWDLLFRRDFGMSSNTGTKTTTTSPRTRATTTRTTSTRTTTATKATQPVATSTNVPYKQLEGVYSERSSAEDQVALELFMTDLPSSPLRGHLSITSVKRSTETKKEYIIISTKNTLPADTDITGFTLKSIVSGAIVQIGKAVYLPFENDINYSENLKLKPGEKVYVISGPSPRGYSFRINKCTGYFEQYQDFTPALPKSCPLVKDAPRPAPPNQLSDICLTDISRVARCIVPTTYKPVTTDQENDCQQFIKSNVGYSNCVSLHRTDTDFFGKNWWVYLNHTVPIWKTKREIIWLLDKEGRFISQYSY